MGFPVRIPVRCFSHYEWFLALNDTSIVWPTFEAVFEDFVDLGVTPVRTSTLLLTPS